MRSWIMGMLRPHSRSADVRASSSRSQISGLRKKIHDQCQEPLLQFTEPGCICTGMRGTGKPLALSVSAITRLVSK